MAGGVGFDDLEGKLRAPIIAEAWKTLIASGLDCWMSYTCGSIGVLLLDYEVIGRVIGGVIGDV